MSLPKPKANFARSGSFFRDGEYIPLFKVTPIYPRRAQERGIMGYAVVSFTITETGTVENPEPLEGAVEIQQILKLYLDHALFLIQQLLGLL